MFLKNIHYFSILVLVVLTASCKKAPNYPAEPSIEYISISDESVFAVQTDTAFIKISFKDGDGDLGYASDLLVKPYDFFVEIQKKEGGSYTTIPTSVLDLNGRLPQQLSSSVGPIDGTILNKVQIPYFGDNIIGGLSRGDSVRFNVRIMDRAGHYSNTITTGDIVIWTFPN